MDTILNKAQEIFFLAMLHGWPAGIKGTDVPGMPGHKETTCYVDGGRWRVTDRYLVSKSKKSAGTVTMWLDDEPAWFMGYSGFYRKSEIPFLKRVLMMNYQKNVFNGGRGPSLVAGYELTPSENLVYVNWTTGNFEKFSSHEEVHPAIGIGAANPLGGHDCWGMALI